jgi:hypothetical protein
VEAGEEAGRLTGRAEVVEVLVGAYPRIERLDGCRHDDNAEKKSGEGWFSMFGRDVGGGFVCASKSLRVTNLTLNLPKWSRFRGEAWRCMRTQRLNINITRHLRIHLRLKHALNKSI